MSTPAKQSKSMAQLLKQLIQIGIALSSERDLSALLDRIVGEARRFTAAEAGTLFLREGERLQFAVVQNEVLAGRWGERELRARFGSEPLSLGDPSLAGHVARTGHTINLPDAYEVPEGRPYRFNAAFDEKVGYQTRSVLVVPLREPSGDVLGVLELINARDGRGRVTPFDEEYEGLIQSLASQAAVAIRNTRLEELSFKDALTGVYNRRYFMLRIDEEAKRHARFGAPVSVALLDVDHFKRVNDELGHAAGDETLREIAQLVVAHSRSFSIVTRYGGDEFAVLLVQTPKAGAVKYAERIRDVVGRHAFRHGPMTVSLGVASLPEDVADPADLLAAADRALYAAKRQGRNSVHAA
jgi:diguanylate cyclase (GGDEF)-like protein